MKSSTSRGKRKRVTTEATAAAAEDVKWTTLPLDVWRLIIGSSVQADDRRNLSKVSKFFYRLMKDGKLMVRCPPPSSLYYDYLYAKMMSQSASDLPYRLPVRVDKDRCSMCFESFMIIPPVQTHLSHCSRACYLSYAKVIKSTIKRIKQRIQTPYRFILNGYYIECDLHRNRNH